jgi:hypothetical protein
MSNTPRPAWVYEPVTVSARVTLNGAMPVKFVQDFIFPNSDEAERFKAWCQLNPDIATWTMSHPTVIRDASSAIGLCTRLAQLEA